MAKKKIDLAAEAKATAGDIDDREIITDEVLLELCPKEMRPLLRKAKTPAARADFLYTLDNGALKEARDRFKALEKLSNKLEAWFVQEFWSDQKGVTGKVARVEVINKEIATAADWTKFYAHVKKKGEFELLNKALNQKAIAERWDAGKEIPGLVKFTKKVISLTKAKGKK